MSHNSSVRMAKIKRTGNTNYGEGVEQLEFSILLVGISSKLIL